MTIGDWAKSLVDSLPWAQKKNGGDRKTATATIDPEAFLRERFSDVEVSEKTHWIEAVSFPWIYLNPRLVKASGRSPEVVSGALARYLNSLDDIDELKRAYAG